MTNLHALFAIVGLLIVSALVLLPSACAKRETYSVIKVCKAPLFRMGSHQSVVKRDSDGTLFVQYGDGKVLPVAAGADMKDLCP